MSPLLTRRQWIGRGAAMLAMPLVEGCKLSGGPKLEGPYAWSDLLTFEGQRLLLNGQPLAREFRPDQVSDVFPSINTVEPKDSGYQKAKAAAFADWRLAVSGLVATPRTFSIADLRALPARTQTTLHSCEQGWSAIGCWTGVPLSAVLLAVGMSPEARFVVVRTVDGWWDSYDMFDVFHPRTILAYGMNGQALPVAHGAPLRLRIERQLGYKSLKYLSSIEVVDRVDAISSGRGSMVSELGFSWYGGI